MKNTFAFDWKLVGNLPDFVLCPAVIISSVYVRAYMSITKEN